MTKQEKQTCSTCLGKKVVPGECQCSMEWRGTQKGDEWEACQCTQEQTCPACGGTGYQETVAS